MILLHIDCFANVDTADGRNCTFRQPFKYLLSIDGKTFKAVIPYGTWINGASIPPCFYAVLQPFGKHWRAAAIHDAAYEYGGIWSDKGEFLPITKAEADDLFDQGMELLGVPSLSNEIEFEAVESFGNSTWEKCRSNDPADKSNPENWNEV